MTSVAPAAAGGTGEDTAGSSNVEQAPPAAPPPPDPGNAATTPQQPHPPPSPLSGCYLLVVLPELHLAQHKDLVLSRLAKGFLSWDKDSCHVDLEKELQALVAQAPEGEEARNGERLIQYATENLVTEVLIYPQSNTLLQCIRNLLASFTKHRHIIHAGYTFGGNGSWILQDGTFSLADFLDAFSEHEVQRVLRAYENSVTVDIHCAGVGDWSTARLSKEPCTRACRVRVNPDDVLTAGVPAITSFSQYIEQYLVAQTLDHLLEPSDIVGNIRFTHPTLYVFPGGQGDAALFGINGFNMLVDGGFARKACFWDFTRHLDRLDAVLFTRINNSNVGGMSSVLQKKKEMHVYPQIGHFFCNLSERRQVNSPDGEKDIDPLILDLIDVGQEMMVNLRHINLRPHPCYRDPEPINLYHKVGHGTLDMYILSPSKDSREVREFLMKWNASDSKVFAGLHKKDSNSMIFPVQNLISICAMLVWKPANPEDTITRILFPGSTPQHKIFEGFERLKKLEFLKYPVCSAKSISPTASTMALKDKPTILKPKSNLFDRETKRLAEVKKEKKETTENKSVKKDLITDETQVKAPPGKISAVSPPKSDLKSKKRVENNRIDSELKESKKNEKDSRGSKDQIGRVEKSTQPELRIKKTDIVKGETEKTAILKDSKSQKLEAKKKENEDGTKQTIKSNKLEGTNKPPSKTKDKKPKPTGEKKDIMKPSPTTPKKSIIAVTNKIESTKSTQKTSARSTSKISTVVPAKSTKDANNRMVIERKNIELASMTELSNRSTDTKSSSKTKTVERKPVTRRAKPASPIKGRVTLSPSKSNKSTPTASVKSEKDAVIRRVKGGTTDSSAVSSPSGAEAGTVLKSLDRNVTEKSEDMSLDSIECKVLADLKEEREVVEEIEAVLQKAERVEARQELLDEKGDLRASDKRDEGVTEDDITAEIDDGQVKISRKESHELTEEDEYLIVEKEEIFTEDSMQSENAEQKHQRDETETEKAKFVPGEYLQEDEHLPDTEKDLSEEKKDEQPEKKMTESFEKSTVDKPIEVETAADISKKDCNSDQSIEKVEEKVDGDVLKGKDLGEKELSNLSFAVKVDSSVDKGLPEKLEGSQEKISTLESGATTAPTLPEDERIPLDEIKEVVDEKHSVEVSKEKDIVKQKEETPEIQEVQRPEIKELEVRPSTHQNAHRDVVKTPDEVADLPVHEEVDPKLYRLEETDREKEKELKSSLQIPEDKNAQADAPVKEKGTGVLGFFGKVADKFEKGIDKLTKKSRRDSYKDGDDTSSKSSSPKEAKIEVILDDRKMEKDEPDSTNILAETEAFSVRRIEHASAKVEETRSFLESEIEASLNTASQVLESEKVRMVGVEYTINSPSTKETKNIEKSVEEESDKLRNLEYTSQDSLKSIIDKGNETADGVRQSEGMIEKSPMQASGFLTSAESGSSPFIETDGLEKVKFVIPTTHDTDEDDSDEVVRDFKGAVRDVAGVLVGTAGIELDRVHEHQPENTMRTLETTECTVDTRRTSLSSKTNSVQMRTDISEDVKNAAVFSLESHVHEPESELEPEKDQIDHVTEEPCVKLLKEGSILSKSPVNDPEKAFDEAKKICDDMMVCRVVEKPETHPVSDRTDEVMELGLEKMCIKEVVIREVHEIGSSEEPKVLVDQKIKFQQELSPGNAEFVTVTPGSTPTSPKVATELTSVEDQMKFEEIGDGSSKNLQVKDPITHDAEDTTLHHQVSEIVEPQDPPTDHTHSKTIDIEIGASSRVNNGNISQETETQRVYTDPVDPQTVVRDVDDSEKITNSTEDLISHVGEGISPILSSGYETRQTTDTTYSDDTKDRFLGKTLKSGIHLKEEDSFLTSTTSSGSQESVPFRQSEPQDTGDSKKIPNISTASHSESSTARVEFPSSNESLREKGKLDEEVEKDNRLDIEVSSTSRELEVSISASGDEELHNQNIDHTGSTSEQIRVSSEDDNSDKQNLSDSTQEHRMVQIGKDRSLKQDTVQMPECTETILSSSNIIQQEHRDEDKESEISTYSKSGMPLFERKPSQPEEREKLDKIGTQKRGGERLEGLETAENTGAVSKNTILETNIQELKISLHQSQEEAIYSEKREPAEDINQEEQSQELSGSQTMDQKTSPRKKSIALQGDTEQSPMTTSDIQELARAPSERDSTALTVEKLVKGTSITDGIHDVDRKDDVEQDDKISELVLTSESRTEEYQINSPEDQDSDQIVKDVRDQVDLRTDQTDLKESSTGGSTEIFQTVGHNEEVNDMMIPSGDSVKGEEEDSQSRKQSYQEVSTFISSTREDEMGPSIELTDAVEILEKDPSSPKHDQKVVTGVIDVDLAVEGSQGTEEGDNASEDDENKKRHAIEEVAVSHKIDDSAFQDSSSEKVLTLSDKNGPKYSDNDIQKEGFVKFERGVSEQEISLPQQDVTESSTTKEDILTDQTSLKQSDIEVREERVMVSHLSENLSELLVTSDDVSSIIEEGGKVGEEALESAQESKIQIRDGEMNDGVIPMEEGEIPDESNLPATVERVSPILENLPDIDSDVLKSSSKDYHAKDSSKNSSPLEETILKDAEMSQEGSSGDVLDGQSEPLSSQEKSEEDGSIARGSEVSKKVEKDSEDGARVEVFDGQMPPLEEKSDVSIPPIQGKVSMTQIDLENVRKRSLLEGNDVLEEPRPEDDPNKGVDSLKLTAESLILEKNDEGSIKQTTQSPSSGFDDINRTIEGSSEIIETQNLVVVTSKTQIPTSDDPTTRISESHCSLQSEHRDVLPIEPMSEKETSLDHNITASKAEAVENSSSFDTGESEDALVAISHGHLEKNISESMGDSAPGQILQSQSQMLQEILDERDHSETLLFLDKERVDQLETLADKNEITLKSSDEKEKIGASDSASIEDSLAVEFPCHVDPLATMTGSYADSEEQSSKLQQVFDTASGPEELSSLDDKKPLHVDDKSVRSVILSASSIADKRLSIEISTGTDKTLSVGSQMCIESTQTMPKIDLSAHDDEPGLSENLSQPHDAPSSCYDSYSVEKNGESDPKASADSYSTKQSDLSLTGKLDATDSSTTETSPKAGPHDDANDGTRLSIKDHHEDTDDKEQSSRLDQTSNTPLLKELYVPEVKTLSTEGMSQGGDVQSASTDAGERLDISHSFLEEKTSSIGFQDNPIGEEKSKLSPLHSLGDHTITTQEKSAAFVSDLIPESQSPDSSTKKESSQDSHYQESESKSSMFALQEFEGSQTHNEKRIIKESITLEDFEQPSSSADDQSGARDKGDISKSIAVEHKIVDGVGLHKKIDHGDHHESPEPSIIGKHTSPKTQIIGMDPSTEIGSGSVKDPEPADIALSGVVQPTLFAVGVPIQKSEGTSEIELESIIPSTADRKESIPGNLMESESIPSKIEDLTDLEEPLLVHRQRSSGEQESFGCGPENFTSGGDISTKFSDNPLPIKSDSSSLHQDIILGKSDTETKMGDTFPVMQEVSREVKLSESLVESEDPVGSESESENCKDLSVRISQKVSITSNVVKEEFKLLPSSKTEHGSLALHDLDRLDPHLDEEITISDSKRTEIESMIMDSYISRGTKFTKKIIDEICVETSLPKYIILEIIEEILMKKNMPKESISDEPIFEDEEVEDQMHSSDHTRSDIRAETGKILESHSISKTHIYDDPDGVSATHKEYESAFHKAFMGGMTEIRTTHITTLSGKSSPDVGETDDVGEIIDRNFVDAKSVLLNAPDESFQSAMDKVIGLKQMPSDSSCESGKLLEEVSRAELNYQVDSKDDVDASNMATTLTEVMKDCESKILTEISNIGFSQTVSDSLSETQIRLLDTDENRKEQISTQIERRISVSEKYHSSGMTEPQTDQKFVEHKSDSISTREIEKELPTIEPIESSASSMIKDLLTDEKSYSGKSSPDVSLPKEIACGGSTGKSTPDMSMSPLIKDSSLYQSHFSGRSTPDKRSDNRSRTSTPEGFRSGDVIRTIVTTTRTMSDDGDIITTTQEVTEATNEKGETIVLAEKTDVKVDGKVSEDLLSDDRLADTQESSNKILEPQDNIIKSDAIRSYGGGSDDSRLAEQTEATSSLQSEISVQSTESEATTAKSAKSSSEESRFSVEGFTVEKEYASSFVEKVTKKYVDEADLDFEKVLTERQESSSIQTSNLIGEKSEAQPIENPQSDDRKDPLAGWGSPLGLPSPRAPRKFYLRSPQPSSSADLSPDSLNFDLMNDWGEPMRLPSPAPSNEISNDNQPDTPKKEKKPSKKVLSENLKNKKNSEIPNKRSTDSRSKVQPVYVDLTYVSHHGNSFYSALEFFKRVRARYYVFSGTEPSREVYDALLEAKKTWEDKNLEVTMIPTYDTDTLGYWVADNEEALAANHIDLSPSASRCTINLQDHETSCSAYRLEF